MLSVGCLVCALGAVTLCVATSVSAETVIPMDQMHVEAMVLDTGAFHECQNSYSTLHYSFTRLEDTMNDRLMMVQQDFDSKAGHVLAVDDALTEKIARTEMAMNELIREVRFATVGSSTSGLFKLPYLILAVVFIGLGIQYAFLTGSVNKVKKQGSLPTAGGGATAAYFV